MKKILPLFGLLILTSFRVPTDSTKEKEVYLCNSKTATKYHYIKNCRGLSNCKHEIIKVTLSKAKEQKRSLCGWED